MMVLRIKNEKKSVFFGKKVSVKKDQKSNDLHLEC